MEVRRSALFVIFIQHLAFLAFFAGFFKKNAFFFLQFKKRKRASQNTQLLLQFDNDSPVGLGHFFFEGLFQSIDGVTGDLCLGGVWC